MEPEGLETEQDEQVSESALETDQSEETVEQPEKKPAEKSVPLSVVIAERRKHQSQIAKLAQSIEDVKQSLSQTQRRGEPSEEQAQKERWNKYLGLDERDQKIAQLEESLKRLLPLADQAPGFGLGTELALIQAVKSVDDYGRSLYSAELGIPQEAFEELFGARITPEVSRKVVKGNYEELDKIADGIFKMFGKKRGSAVNRSKEVAQVKNLPAAPGKGGTQGVSEREEPAEPQTRRQMHDAAFAHLQQAQQRRGK